MSQNTRTYQLKTSIAGGIAGCLAKTVVAPLDRVKILFQTNNPSFVKYSGSFLGVFLATKSIYLDSGIHGLLQGHSATLLRIYPYASIKFAAYEQFKLLLAKNSNKNTIGARRFLAGALAGVTAVGFSYPFELLRVRLAFQIKNESNAISIKSTFLKIFNEPNELFSNSTFLNRIGAGIGNFYRGFLATVLGIAPYAGISFLTYESLKSSLMEKYSEKSNKKRLNTNVELLIGGVAGAAGQTVSYPLEIIRRHIQVAGITGQGKRLSIIETARDIFKQRGIRGFFVGLTIGYIKVVPLSAVSFVTYDFMKRVMEID